MDALFYFTICDYPYLDRLKNKRLSDYRGIQMDWYLKVLRNYVGFSGRARRKEYWMFILVNFIFALVLTRTEVTTYTVQVTHYFGGQSNFWTKIAAMSVLGTLPVFVAVATMQRYLVRGISLGAVKG